MCLDSGRQIPRDWLHYQRLQSDGLLTIQPMRCNANAFLLMQGIRPDKLYWQVWSYGDPVRWALEAMSVALPGEPAPPRPSWQAATSAKEMPRAMVSECGRL